MSEVSRHEGTSKGARAAVWQPSCLSGRCDFPVPAEGYDEVDVSGGSQRVGVAEVPVLCLDDVLVLREYDLVCSMFLRRHGSTPSAKVVVVFGVAAIVTVDPVVAIVAAAFDALPVDTDSLSAASGAVTLAATVVEGHYCLAGCYLARSVAVQAFADAIPIDAVAVAVGAACEVGHSVSPDIPTA